MIARPGRPVKGVRNEAATEVETGAVTVARGAPAMGAEGTGLVAVVTTVRAGRVRIVPMVVRRAGPIRAATATKHRLRGIRSSSPGR